MNKQVAHLRSSVNPVVQAQAGCEPKSPRTHVIIANACTKAKLYGTGYAMLGARR